MPDHQVPFIEACYRAVRSYRPPTYRGRVVLLRARSFPSLGPWPVTDDFGWNCVTGQAVTVISVPGSHGTLIAPPFVRYLAIKLDRLLTPGVAEEEPEASAARPLRAS